MTDPLDDVVEKLTEQDIRLFLRRRRFQHFVSFGAGVLSGAGTYAYANTDSSFFDIGVSVFNGLCMYAFFRVHYSQPFSVFSLRGLRQVGRSLRDILGHLQQRISPTVEGELSLKKREVEFVTEARVLTRDPITRYQLGITLALCRGYFDLALRRALHLMDSYERFGQSPAVERWRSRLESMLFFPFISSPHTHLGIALRCLRRGDLHSTQRHLQKASSIEGQHQLQMACLYNHLLSHRASSTKDMKDIEIAKRQWRHTLERILSEPHLPHDFRRLGASRNEVLEFGGENLLHDLFVFKRNGYLQREYVIDEFLYDVFGQSEVVPEPLAFFAYDGKSYLVSRRMPGHVLADGVSEDALLDFFPFLFQFHREVDLHQGELAARGVKLSPPNYRGSFHRRYLQRSGRQEELQRATSFLLDVVEGEPVGVCHGDVHPRNVLKRSGGFTLLDPEHLCLGTVKLDLADLLESHRLQLPDTFVLVGVRSYYNEQPSGSFDRFYRGYAACAVVTMLETLGSLEVHSYGMEEAELEMARASYRARISRRLGELAHSDSSLREATQRLDDLVHS
jgi:hypothetical protein